MKAMHSLESCTENSSARTGVHGKVQEVWMLMPKSAGFESVWLEGRAFGAISIAYPTVACFVRHVTAPTGLRYR